MVLESSLVFEGAMVELIYNVSGALDGSRRAVGVLCDLTKPFDTVDHAILIGELEKLGLKAIK